MISRHVEKIDNLESESNDLLKTMRSRKPHANTVSQHRHCTVNKVRVVVANFQVVSHEQPDGVEANYVDDSKRTNVPLMQL